MITLKSSGNQQPTLESVVRSLVPGNVTKEEYQKALELSMALRGITRLEDGSFTQEGRSATSDPRGGGRLK